MERHKRDKKHRKRAPRVPIKTYRWEDIRRERLRGGYPWTYLYKEPFKEQTDTKLSAMESKWKSKSSKATPKPSERLVIQEVTNGSDNHQDSLTPEPSGYIVITEVPSDSENHSKPVTTSSVTIEDVDEPEVLNLESAESSDNISQYLDKEEPVAEPAQTTPTTSKAEDVTAENGRQERAKSEEPKRKRKLSIDSSYSRKSLSKLAIIKKLKEARDKIKVPKLTLPKSLKKEASVKSKTEEEAKPVDVSKQYKPKRNEIPVYIHIPLKPPEGETDEFSYLEFGETKPEEPEKTEEPEKPAEEPEPVEPHEEVEGPPGGERRFSGDPDDIVAFEILKSETIDLEHATKNGLHGGSDYLIIQDDDNKNDNMIIIMPGADEPALSRQGSKRLEPGLSRQGSKRLEQPGLSRQGSNRLAPSRQGSKRERAKSAEPERKRKLSAESGHSRVSLSKLGLMKKLRDAKDKLKLPKLSLSRSNSKKELQKKQKEESSAPKESKKEVEANKEAEPKTEVKKEKSSSKEPKYIHIPLKPPPGETDEFSYLEFEEKKEEVKPAEPETSAKEEQQGSVESPESPESPKAEGVQFIFLTPPSDDEILDHPDVPETPSSETKNFFETNVTELKVIAKTAVEETTPKSRKKLLQAVTEEEGSNGAKSAEQPSDADDEKPVEKVEKMVVDEEDGLKLTESAMAKQEQNIKAKEVTEPSQELKSNLKADSPVLKKKVSFKRRSTDDSKDGIYEDVQAPAGDKSGQKDKSTDEHKGKLAVMGNSQSMSADEEKSYLDEKKIIKSTSLEEDYNRWSKLSDHEYEPVNPPPDNIPPASTAPTVHIIDTDRGLQQKPISQASSTTSLERRMLGAEIETSPEESQTVQEMQTEIENKFFSKTSEPQPQTTAHTVTTVSTSETQSKPPKHEGPGKFQQAIKTQADKFKTKLHEFKKPNIKLPSKPKIKKPNFQKMKFEKPKFNLPKLPDTAKINLPTFSLPRRSPVKRSLKERQLSTESNAGDSKKSYFDFRTYPRLFRKKPKDDLDSFSSKSEREVPEFATVPRTKRNKESDRWGGRDTIRIPLHAEDSIEDEEREDSVERRMASHIRYDQDIDIDDAYEKENQEIHTASPFSHSYNSRWNHGSFHPDPNEEDSRNRQVTDLDSPEDEPAPHESFDTNTSKDIHSSESSLGIHRRGVLEEIDSDEFFLRQKGISQDNIEVGMYLSSEIREAFKYPTNALADLQGQPRDFPFDATASNQSLPETPSKRKSAKKPKRKKTPHVSQEQISFDQDSELDTEIPPSRPKRRSKRNKKQRQLEEVVPYQETIAVDVPDANLGIVRGPEEHEEFRRMYENEQMQGKEQPEINVIDPYAEYEGKYESDDEVFRDEDIRPSAPPRKNRSLKSLNFSEHDSILGDFNQPLHDIEVYKTEHEYIIPTPEVPPTKPPRTLSRSSSKSQDHEEAHQEVEEAPVRPTRSRSRTRSRADSLTLEEPCVEEICVQDFRDSMGYAVIDKNARREPPLPPPRTPPRRKRSVQPPQESQISERKFFTVPRPLNDEPPSRPLRNYSTLGPSRPPRRKHPVNMTDEEKENIDITQYIEIDDEPNRDLHSGEVIQKMRDRPLPAPPRPPRKMRTLQDITSQENIAIGSQENVAGEAFDEEKTEIVEEAEVSTQTEPLPDDFLCDEFAPQEPEEAQPLTIEHESTPVVVERRLITPTHYTYQETVTHGSLVVEPLNGARILPDSDISRVERPVERSVSITRDYEDETSEIPEEFTKLKDPSPAQTSPPPVQTSPPQPSVIERIIERPVVIQPDSGTEVEVLKAQKLQVADLDVDRLSVNELLASKIIVSEIDSGNIQATEISSKTGALKIGEIELPPSVIQQLFEKLQSAAQEQQSSGPIESRPVAETSTKKEAGEETGQKKNSV